MLHIDNIDVMNVKNALRGMRNAYGGGRFSDTTEKDGKAVIGKYDLDLAQKLVGLGSDHRKFLRQIFVTMDIKAPLYWWKEFDTYKVGTVALSESTMHTLHKNEITVDMFSVDGFDEKGLVFFESVVDYLEHMRKMYNSTGYKYYWENLIKILPCSFNQMRTVTMNFENVLSMYHQRKAHKLDEWKTFCDYCSELPYSELLFN